MANGTDVHPQEIEFRRRWYEAHCRRAEDDSDYEEMFARRLGFRARADEAFPMRDRLAADSDLDRFRNDLHSWGRNSGVMGFNGPSGSGFVNTLVKRTDDRAELAQLLVDGLTAPRDQSDARSKIEALVEHIERVRVGGHPAPGHVPFLLSFFWGMDESFRWPILWPGARKFLELMTGQQLPDPLADRYLRFVDLIKELDDDSDRFLVAAYWWHQRSPILLDEVLVDRVIFHRRSGSISRDMLTNSAHTFMAITEHIGEELLKDISDILNHKLILEMPELAFGPGGKPRSERWIYWQIKEYPLGLRLWITHKGVAIGVYPNLWQKGWLPEATTISEKIDVEGFHMKEVQAYTEGDEDGFYGSSGSFVYGRWYEPDQLAGLDLRAEVREVAKAARPVIEALTTAVDEWPPGPPPPLSPPPDDPIDIAARELLVKRSFLDDIVSLLEDKGQVILYGPPGTGKTYLAKRLAEALVPDSEFRSLVQFHPSTSYEDFFEGYRPVPAADGGIGYELTRGPLARMAAHAEEHQERHVMVIDEINRANLPRVLGELLFLFEYRDEQVSTLYRSDAEFGLPDTVWFIGTMNTADRSIALVDAALRRRFHFVPFFPGRGPTVGLLGRWLEREEEPKWVDGLVEMVNGELTKYVGEDLQLGFSHFMRKGYEKEPSESDETLRRIWQYNIEPFVEDQLFGDADRIKEFRFGEVMSRFRREAGYTRSQDDASAETEQPEGELGGPEEVPDEGATP